MVEAHCGADRFGRHAKMVAERAGECFVRAVVRIQRQREDIGRAGGERTRRLAEPAGPHIAHHRQSGCRGKRPDHVKARDTGDAGDLVQRQGAGEMAFDEPERLLGRIHGTMSLRSKRAHHDAVARGAFDRHCCCPRTSSRPRGHHQEASARYFPPSFAAGASLAGGAAFFCSSAAFFCAACKSSTVFCSEARLPFSASICRLAASSFC